MTPRCPWVSHVGVRNTHRSARRSKNIPRLGFRLVVALSGAPPRASDMAIKNLYATAETTAGLLRAGRKYQRDRLRAADMISLGEAASLMEVDESMVTAWVRTGRCIGIPGRAIVLPRWQFDPSVWPAIQVVGNGLGTTDGWQVLCFMETPASALNGLTPRVALEQGVPISRVLDVAIADAH